MRVRVFLQIRASSTTSGTHTPTTILPFDEQLTFLHKLMDPRQIPDRHTSKKVPLSLSSHGVSSAKIGLLHSPWLHSPTPWHGDSRVQFTALHVGSGTHTPPLGLRHDRAVSSHVDGAA